MAAPDDRSQRRFTSTSMAPEHPWKTDPAGRRAGNASTQAAEDRRRRLACEKYGHIDPTASSSSSEETRTGWAPAAGKVNPRRSAVALGGPGVVVAMVVSGAPWVAITVVAVVLMLCMTLAVVVYLMFPQESIDRLKWWENLRVHRALRCKRRTGE